ncbi:hypothetical protein [Sinorhizobium meliloti]
MADFEESNGEQNGIASRTNPSMFHACSAYAIPLPETGGAIISEQRGGFIGIGSVSSRGGRMLPTTLSVPPEHLRHSALDIFWWVANPSLDGGALGSHACGDNR